MVILRWSAARSSDDSWGEKTTFRELQATEKGLRRGLLSRGHPPTRTDILGGQNGVYGVSLSLVGGEQGDC